MTNPRKPAVQKAPDGLPYPKPQIICDTSEQAVYAFGYKPARWATGAPVHYGEIAASSLVNELLEGPWDCARGNLFTGDYQLRSPLTGLPLPPAESGVIERKGRDFIGSITAEHDRFVKDECPRLAEFRARAIIVESPIESLLGSRSGLLLALDAARYVFRVLLSRWERPETPEEQEEHAAVTEAEAAAHELLGAIDDERQRSTVSARALLGITLSIVVDYQIPILFLPSRAWAEYAAAWMLRRSWRRWLNEHPEGLAAARLPVWPSADKVALLAAPVVDIRDHDETPEATPAFDDAAPETP